MRLLRHQILGIAAAAVVFAGLVSSVAIAGPVVPAGLNPGDQYYLAFVTQGSRDGTSTNIADYNSFAQTQAALNPSLTGTDVGVTWKALGSTASVNALTNLGLGAFPIYLLNGTTKVADNATDLWDGSLDSAIGLDQFLASFTGTVLTGTLSNGNGGGQTALGVGLNFFGDIVVEAGLANRTNSGWVSVSGGTEMNSLRRFYAFSQLLTVPVPEPSGLALASAATMGLLAIARKRRKERSSAGR